MHSHLFSEHPQYISTSKDKLGSIMYIFHEDGADYSLYQSPTSHFIDWEESSYHLHWDDLPFWFQEAYAELSLELLKNFELKSLISKPKYFTIILEEFIHCHFVLNDLQSRFMSLHWLLLEDCEIQKVRSIIALFNEKYHADFQLEKDEYNAYRITEKSP